MNIIRIPQSSGLKRKLPDNYGQLITKKYTRSFEENYDWYTFCVDAIRVSRTRVLLICPRLEGLEESFQIKTKKDRDIRFTVNKISPWTDHVIVNTTLDEFNISFNGKLVTVEVGRRSERFKDKHILTTTQKDENINWIIDWVGYYKKLHKIDSFVIYDNDSTTYTAKELERIVQKSHPDVDFIVENMNIPYGAETTKWNCVFTQNTGFEHLKQKYAWCAKSVVNHDIDELMYLRGGMEYDQLIDEMFSKNKSFCTYHGHHIDNFDQQYKVTSDKLDYNQLKYYNYYRSICIGKQTKWVCLPSKMMNVAWTTHGMNETGGKLRDSFMMTNKISYGHYNSHRTSQFYGIDKLPKTYHPVIELYNSLRKVYGDLVPLTKESKSLKESVLIIRLSCKKESLKWPRLLRESELDQIIIYGDENLKTNYRLRGNYLALKCKDDWEHLPEKMILAYKAIHEIEGFKKYDHYVKIDSNYDPNKVLWPLVRKTIKTLPEIWGGVYFGPPGKGDYHFDKELGPKSFWYKKRYTSPWPQPRLNGGVGYGFSRRCLNILAKSYDWESSVEINHKHIYEDVMVSHLLHESGIIPVGYADLGGRPIKKPIRVMAQTKSPSKSPPQNVESIQERNLVVQIFFDHKLISNKQKTHTNHNRGPLITSRMRDHSLFHDSQKKAKQYAEKCGADYVLFDKPVTNFFSASMERMRLIEEDKWAENYDNILYLDCDTIINENCPNLFEAYPQKNLRVCHTLMAKKWLLSKESTMAEKFGEETLLNNYFNGGVLLFHSSTLKAMKGKLKYRERFNTYAFDDQSELNWVVMDNNIPITFMERKFNSKPGTNVMITHFLGNLKHRYKQKPTRNNKVKSITSRSHNLGPDTLVVKLKGHTYNPRYINNNQNEITIFRSSSSDRFYNEVSGGLILNSPINMSTSAIKAIMDISKYRNHKTYLITFDDYVLDFDSVSLDPRSLQVKKINPRSYLLTNRSMRFLSSISITKDVLRDEYLKKSPLTFEHHTSLKK